MGLNVSHSNQYLSKGIRNTIGQSSKDKNSLLYHDLKKKLSYENAQTVIAGSGSGQGSNLAVRKAESMSGLGTTFHSAKSMRPASASLQQKNLYLANQKSSGTTGTSLQDRIQIARLKKSNLAQGNSTEDVQ